jgi:uncharacterized protein with von Willebrand factor type A (vWA) domain
MREAETALIDGAGRPTVCLRRSGAWPPSFDVGKLFDEAGNLRPMHELDDEMAACIAFIEVVRQKTTSGEASTTETWLHKIKAWDKVKALDMLARHLQLLNDTLAVTLTGQIDPRNFSDEKLDMARGAGAQGGGVAETDGSEAMSYEETNEMLLDATLSFH